MNLPVIVVIVAAAALAAATYLGLERVGRRGLAPMAARAIAWAALGLLLINVSCPRAPDAGRPIVLLDGSLSMTAAGAGWDSALALARRTGDVRFFGDERDAGDTLPTRGRSLLRPALSAAAASDRPIVVVTDGEIDDVPDLPPDLLDRAAVRVVPRDSIADLALTALAGPARVTAGDSIVLEAEVRATRTAGREGVTVAVSSARGELARRPVAFDGSGIALVRIAVPSAGLAAGDHVLRASVAVAGDGEPRTDTRLHLVTIAATPGVVLVATPGDWDSRALYRTLRDVAELPVRGYIRLGRDSWHAMSDLAPVSADAVRRAARGADLLVLKGSVDGFTQGLRARGIWSWPSGENGESLLPGDWYVSAVESSPIAGAFLGLPVDSFPPATRITPIEPPPGAWVAMEAQERRRGANRPIVVGRDEGRVRRVTVAADGLWRWAFRGGSSEQGYRAWVAATASWLLGGADSARGAARPVRPVVQNGRPVVFEWAQPGAPRELGIGLTADAGPRSDTLRFDGSGRAMLRLPPGTYQYRLSDGGTGTVAVEEYSDEFVARTPTLAARESRAPRPSARSLAREWIWLFGVAVAALALEWVLRRRLGLR
ncbi:MAG TPA: hypothetical protein VFT04_05330 [Gemmatimonadales bacterium]|nr:hypothetical protein [Gemmatimonadales bacterium]